MFITDYKCITMITNNQNISLTVNFFANKKETCPGCVCPCESSDFEQCSPCKVHYSLYQIK